MLDMISILVMETQAAVATKTNNHADPNAMTGWSRDFCFNIIFIACRKWFICVPEEPSLAAKLSTDDACIRRAGKRIVRETKL